MRRNRAIPIFFALLSILTLTPALHAAPAKMPDRKKIESITGDLEAYAKKGMADWKVPGMAIAIVQGDDIVYKKAFGVKIAGGNDPVTIGTIFQIGSASKAFTAALVAMVVDDGKVKWGDQVVNHLDTFMMYDPWVTRQFTVTDLMAQHSGMPAHAEDTASMIGFGRDYIIDKIRFVKPVTSFRSEYAYQNNLFLVASKLVEKYTRKSWEENIEERVFSPLGMTSSSVDLASFKAAKNVALPHRRMDDKIITLPMSWPSMDWVYIYGPAGGINSNVEDMAKWIRLQMHDGSFTGKKLISPESMRHMHTPVTVIPSEPPVTRQYYCQGWVYREACPYPIIWHNGGTSGFKTMVAFIPQAKVGIVVLSNLDDTDLPESLAYRFFDRLFDNQERDWSAEALAHAAREEKEGKLKLPKPPVKPTPALPLEKYVGDYANDIYGTITVSQKDRRLLITVGPKKVIITAQPFDRDIFALSWELYTQPEDVGLARFDINPDGVAGTLNIEALDGDGGGVFQKAAK